ncbi:hypothetical protein DEA8626_01954 [Defluviimonas aquaemixtae]|uniref:Heparan-alpha-glucosaminide N-acetyltransferase catalytic domain-containing protein n=1 Tax=Albidovulum aquaemixtae TaxID=1542388 RepID=A0A2R8B747_9RHOB|nr:heparan-alpha-glucosaminide N-acetyltransferase [Defluviimonas aquaemixtae]SPH18416.1 hypothetical protein DEA8626_01954 [Defluviimonas aquaemixtae]
MDAATDRAGGGGRIAAIDIARTVALIGMVVYHFTYDLQNFGLIAPSTATTGGWAIFARVVAGSFLFLAGVSLWLAHGRGIRWLAFRRRLVIVALAAALITVATWLAMPDRFVFFGILHSIAFASLIGLAFLRVPAPLTLAIAAAIVALRLYGQSVDFDAPWFAWTGLAANPPGSIDFVPPFPWLASCLAGIALARLATRTGLWDRLRSAERAIPTRAAHVLAWPGRHSLPIYLIHQPVLIGLIWAATRAFG